MWRYAPIICLLWGVPVLADTAPSDCTAATGWATTPTNALSITDSGAVASTAATGQPSLQINFCSMNIRSGATINGIEVRVVGCGNGSTGVRTMSVNLLHLGTCTPKTVVLATCPTMTDTTLGGTSDLWSCTGVSETAVNDAQFGASIQTDTSHSQTESIDYISLTVTYTGGDGMLF